MHLAAVHAPPQAAIRGSSLSGFWLACSVVGIALAWLLPNHYAPWTTFHMDAWMACVLSVVAGWLFLRARAAAPWTGTPLVLLLAVALPGLQYATGLVVQPGTAWICTAYLLGFLLAWLAGAQWESGTPGQLGEALLAAVGIAALLSVGLALHQGLLLDRLDVWAMGGGATRATANLGQPNQLGTLLVWGLLAIGWAHVRQRIGVGVSLFAAAFLMLGIAMTGSRTAWVALLLLMAAVWWWRRLWPHRGTPLALAGLGAWFMLCVATVGPLLQWILGVVDSDVADIVRISGEARPTLWALFLDASLQRPWFGYGWGQVSLAFMEVAKEHPSLQVHFSHSHNLFLDLILWCGWPLGLAFSAFLLWWIVSRALRVRNAQDALLFLVVLVVANHAMLELPLHHAYFLLPVGLVMGALDMRLGIRARLQAGRWRLPLVGILWLLATAMLAGIIRDYTRVETAYQGLRYEWANIRTPPVQPPDVLLLTQWRDFVRMVKWDSTQPVSAAELRWMEHVTSLNPNIGLFQIYAMALARSGQPDKAAHWLQTMCKALPEAQCARVASFWRFKAGSDPVLAAVPWPSGAEARP
jgi:O-antigen ligase